MESIHTAAHLFIMPGNMAGMGMPLETRRAWGNAKRGTAMAYGAKRRAIACLLRCDFSDIIPSLFPERTAVRGRGMGVGRGRKALYVAGAGLLPAGMIARRLG